VSEIGSNEELSAQLVLELTVHDLERSLQFYSTLGFKMARRTDDFAALRFEGAWLFLARGPKQAPTEHNLRVLVRDVDAVWNAAQQLNAHVEREIGDRNYGLRDFTISDPDGFQLRFAAPT
jgi:catechol 2,3-dioxygenase-like lactoylglutathione lyase family enzyme